MHRYEELEKLYYKKKYQKIFFIFLLVFLILLILFIVFKKGETTIKRKIIFKPEKIKINKPSQNEVNQSVKKIVKVKKKKNIKPKHTTLHTEQKQLKFILPDINNTNETVVMKKNINKLPVVKKENNKTTSPEIHLNNIRIKETSVKNVKILIKKFDENPDFDLAIVISKIFLEQNNLKNAQIWALRANELNPQKIDSWLIFSDILIKEKKPQKAKEILKTYINSYGPNDIIENKLRSINEE